MGQRLPRIDEHCLTIAADRDRVWSQLWPVLSNAMGGDVVKRQYARAVGAAHTEASGAELRPGSTVVGFEVEAAEPHKLLVLGGRHRFSRYELIFRLDDVEGGTRLCAETRAVFPGIAGRLYETLVIRSGTHALVTGRMLDAVRRRAER